MRPNRTAGGNYADVMADTPSGGGTAPPSPPVPSGPPAAAGPPAYQAGGPVARGRRLGWRRGLVLAAVILVIAGCAVAMLLTLGESLGAQALLIGIVAAILPVPVLVACFLWLDRYEPEPTGYLVLCFGWGAAVATYTSLQVNDAAAKAFANAGLPDALVAVLVAPFIEELTKAAFPILLLIFRRREWSGIVDGIVYCGLSAVGFAMVENILYLGGHGYAAGAQQYGPATGAQYLFATFIVRILFSGFAHPLFTSMTGVGLGLAARTADRRVRVLAPIAGLLVAMMMHGTWNLVPSLAVALRQNLILLYGYLSVMVPIFFGMVGLAVWLRSWEGRLTERTLIDYVRAGWLTPPEVAALGSLGRRHAARQWARRVAGEAGVRAMREYQFTATRLALLRDGLRRGLDTRPGELARSTNEERNMLARISALRSVFVGRDPQVPAATWDGSRYHIVFPDGVRRSLDAPDEPVVPIPVVLTPPPARGWPGTPMPGR
ncbi:PrsW family intramembrane metalloprotease [Plantactinospora sp. KBS50]|uniref:PrsW family intramembrane metalloprotease n=1 Tax=Plantactinospora sp. KBS50 TaxID=2024580 RepID=UPI000BAAB02B|nr:PrsW family intramembrane metalloprotease [Plantactinospora sp. KBS50]ASW58035.1 PrsW family intramembrane metalloprotease [Plantactinospora sp. KBS50]